MLMICFYLSTLILAIVNGYVLAKQVNNLTNRELRTLVIHFVADAVIFSCKGFSPYLNFLCSVVWTRLWNMCSDSNFIQT